MRTGRSIRLVAPLAVAAVTAAACGSSSSGGGDNGGSNSSGKSYTIACQGPLTGDNAALGINICDGAKLAIDQANAKGDLGFTLKFLGVDDQGSPDKAPAASQSEVSNDSVVAVVGPAFSGATQASEKNFANAGLVSVTASATLPTLTDPANGFTTFYRAVATDSSQGQGAAEYLSKKLNVKTVYSIDDAEAYGQGLAKELDKNLQADGIKVIHDGLPQGTKPGPEAAKVVQSGADATRGQDVDDAAQERRGQFVQRTRRQFLGTQLDQQRFAGVHAACSWWTPLRLSPGKPSFSRCATYASATARDKARTRRM